MRYTIETPPDAGAAYDAIWARLLAFNQAVVGDAVSVPFALTIKSSDDESVQGGLWATSLWGSFYIALVVVPEEARGTGVGQDMMQRAELEAHARKCRHIWLDTYAFQARPFYERLGYEVFGQLDGPPPMFPRYFMRKEIAGSD